MDLFKWFKKAPEPSPLVKELQAKKRDVLKKRAEDELKSLLTRLKNDPTGDYGVNYVENVSKLRNMGFKLYVDDYNGNWYIYVK